MRTWIKVILSNKESIARACSTLDRHLDSAAKAAFSQTGQQAYDTIVKLLDRKHDLQCLLLLRESMLNKLDERQFVAVSYIEGNVDKTTACSQLKLSGKAFVKFVDNLYHMLCMHCVELGYNTEYLKKHYCPIGFLFNKYKNINRAA